MQLSIHRLALTVLLAASGVAAQGGNVLVLIADDLGVDKVGAYAEGTSPPPTPNIDALAQSGILFRNAWATAQCSSTRACLHTGRHGYRTGVGSPGGAELRATELTLPELLDARGSGYAHALIGKWHLNRGNTAPNEAGWSHFAGFAGADVGNYHQWTRIENGVAAPNTTYSTTQQVDDALAWIGAQSQPWLCIVAFNAPHGPLSAPPAHLHSQNLNGLNPQQHMQEFYTATVEAMDTEIGRLLQGLGSERARTDVFFMGDNGTPARLPIAPFVPRRAKGTAYEGGVNVPLIVSGPAVQSPGREEPALVHAVDLYPTIAALAGVDATVPFVAVDGISMLPYLLDTQHSAARAAAYSELFDSDPDTDGFACARDARHKIIRTYTATGHSDELYDLLADPFESNDLLAGPLSPAQLAAANTLIQSIEDIRNTDGSFTPYGTADCVGSNGIPLIAGAGTPRIGARYTVRLRSAPAATVAVLHLGQSTTAWRGLPLPFDLGLIGGGAGCRLYASGEALVPATTDAAGRTSIPLRVPAQAVLVGGAIHHAWSIFDPTAPGNALQITTTQGLTVRPGR